MALYQITISYDGTDFHGFQRQPNNRTVQGEIERALMKLGWTGRTITSSGRTDTGVHAEGQIATFELDWNHSEEELGKAVNYLLPSDISINRAIGAKKGFHPRYDAKLRKYRYQIYVSSTAEPLAERYHWRVWPEPNFELMNQAAKVICGEHNFFLYGKPPKEGGRTLRNVESVEWKRDEGNKAFLQIKANSFLYHMVRRISFILVRVGQGKVMIDKIVDSFNGIDNLPPGIAPAKGLFLEEIFY
jgi:tRNA pseudouridine38-40 synthase